MKNIGEFCEFDSMAGAARALAFECFVCLLLLVFIAPAYAQSTFGSVKGTVQDDTGAVISRHSGGSTQHR